MKILWKTVSLLAVLAAVAPGAASAQTPPANTGASGNVNALFQDAAWQVSTNGGTTWFQAFQVQNPPGVWQTATPAYSWISATSSGTGGGGDYYFRTLFNLTGYDASTAVLSFQCALDNLPSGSGYYSLNGGAYGGSCGQQSSYQFTGVNTVNSGFLGGINEIRFHVTGDATTDGLVVGDMGLSARAVTAAPEPATFVLLATGMLGVFGVARRKRTPA